MPVDDYGRLTDDQGTPLLTGTVLWSCPNCDTEEVTAAYMPNRFHSCPGLHMLTAPLLRPGVKAKVEAEERQDYQGRELTHEADDGRVYSSVRTTRENGDDLAVLAPTAQLYG
jgi:hypothetical protein